jgi:beta-phosphoglucomutase-like phosphatase (HAD superfamily)
MSISAIVVDLDGVIVDTEEVSDRESWSTGSPRSGPKTALRAVLGGYFIR